MADFPNFDIINSVWKEIRTNPSLGPIHRNLPRIYIAYGTPNCMHVDVVTQNITKFTRKEPVRIRARKEDTKLNAPSSKSQRPNSFKLGFMPVWQQDRTDDRVKPNC